MMHAICNASHISTFQCSLNSDSDVTDLAKIAVKQLIATALGTPKVNATCGCVELERLSRLKERLAVPVSEQVAVVKTTCACLSVLRKVPSECHSGSPVFFRFVVWSFNRKQTFTLSTLVQTLPEMVIYPLFFSGISFIFCP